MSCHGMMMGLPTWALATAIGAAGLVSLWGVLAGGTFFTRRTPSPWRVDLLRYRPLHALARHRITQTLLQIPQVVILFWILYTGFFGTKVASHNPTTVLTWTFWWTLLILDIILLGRMWCMVCPWEAVASWLRRLAFWRRSDEPLALNLPWPRWLKNVYPATILFVGLTWLELGFGVTQSPRATAILGLLMLLLAVVPALVFERRSFCRYGCLIGRICGLYSMLAPVEVRTRDAEVCRRCKTKDCLKGNERGYACPTGVFVATLDTNAHCTVCTECIKSCPQDNVTFRLRPWASDLFSFRTPRRDEAVLALAMVSLTSFHGLTMTPAWNRFVEAIGQRLQVGHLAAFSLGMAGVLVLPAAIFLLHAGLIRRVLAPVLPATTGTRRLTRFSAAYAYPLVAVALMYHLAHNAGHFLTEAGVIVNVVHDPLARGAGTAGMVMPLVSQQTIWAIAIVFVLIGHVWATRAMEQVHRRTLAGARAPVGRRLVLARLGMSLFLFLVTSANLWLLAQPMEMRTGM